MMDSSDHTNPGDDGFDQQSYSVAELRQLARNFSRGLSYQTTSASIPADSTSEGDIEKTPTTEKIPTHLNLQDPRLNPDTPEFDAKIWVQTVVREARAQDLLHSPIAITFSNLNITGVGSELQFQSTVGSPLNMLLNPASIFKSGKSEKHILRNFAGTIDQGEMLIVLGRPGSGCSTFLKTLCGELHGLKKQSGSKVEYNGLEQETFKKEFRGEAVYSAENEHHFPHLTVGETLSFAAAARTPSKRLEGWSREDAIELMTSIVMNIFGLSHTRNTKVGNDFIRGVSGGERKRVSIAEMALASSPFAAWDNSTRGLDSSTALSFVRSLRTSAEVFGVTHAVATYQASQSIYELFDKAIVLYEGRQIFFGPASEAKAYFEYMGYYCSPRQTTGDFLTSVTNPSERQAREGFEDKVPRTSDEFEAYWRASEPYKRVLAQVDQANESKDAQQAHKDLRSYHVQNQAKHMRAASPYTISIAMQVRLCTKRAWQRIWNDKTSTLSQVLGNALMALIVASIFYGTPQTTSSFFSKASILFFAILLNALSTITEINTLYEQRPIVEKHTRFAFYHPASDALAGILMDIPVKFVTAVVFNIIIYFLGGLTYQAGKFFVFFLFVFVTTLSMSGVFRTMAAASKTITQALAAAGILVLVIVIYTGFVITPQYQKVWFFWLQYLNPVRYAYEALLANELHGQYYECASIVPPYGTDGNFACAVAGAVEGQRLVSGDAYIQASYEYYYSHVWRNFGIVLAFLIFFYFTYLFMTEINAMSASTAEFLVFKRGHAPPRLTGKSDEEAQAESTRKGPAHESASELPAGALGAQKDLFTWQNVTLDIQIGKETRRLLDNVSGYVKPGTLTALMGVSGAGKTTLLDTLAQRVSVGVLTGDMLVNGKPLPAAFQRNTGYCQQQDIHLESTTVREALRFSAMLRQPSSVSRKEKYEFVEEVVHMLGMEEYAEAVVGNPGEGLNVEQRKMLTIGVELAAKPDLLLFLDEPTSGLDSQSSWSIISFLRKLANGGQAILTTIHQPSAILFQEFDRLLFLAKGGKTVYFGEIGKNSHTLLEYFSRNGARQCGAEENPAEYMLEVIGGRDSEIDWPAAWKKSDEARAVGSELESIAEETKDTPVHVSGSSSEFAAPLSTQLWHVTIRAFQYAWRSPSYIYGKFVLGIVSALFVGFSYYRPPSTQAGVQNLVFSSFMLTSIFSTLAQQIMPRFVAQRSVYEVRERPSKSYSWIAFMFANSVVEIPYHVLLSVIVYASWYFPIFGANQTSEQQALMFLFCLQFFVFAGTFATMVVAGLPDAATAGTVATLLFSLSLTFNGVLATPGQLPGFWIFMYRVSPLTYFIGGWTATGGHDIAIQCSSTETAVFSPPAGQTCAQYLAPYLQSAPGYLQNPGATANCSYCPLSVSDQFLASSQIYWSDRWRNFGILFAYNGFNIAAAIALYYLCRVRQWSSPGETFAAWGARLSSLCKCVLRGRDDDEVVEEEKRNSPAALQRHKTNERVY